MNDHDRQAIEWTCSQLVARYAILLDEGRWDELGALYAEDGVLVRPSAPDEPVVGREAILTAFRSRPARYARHFFANTVVDVESADRARAVSRILLFTAAAGHAVDDGDDLPIVSGPPLVGEYHDVLVRGDGGWRFAERRGRLAFRP